MKDFLQTVDLCIKEGLLMQGQLTALTDEKNKIVERVEKAKIWLQKQPDYIKFLKQLQEILHQKNIGAFSELLSYFVKDVLQKDTKSINSELYTYHNLPALRIEALNNGQKESIIEGNGGSIANIVSTGLRLIALSRMKNRQFIVLDEPDCWLKPDHIPLFAKIIGEISQKLRIQTVIISHHHWSYFKDYGRVIELKKGDVQLETTIVHDTSLDGAPDDTIKKVIMRRFMSHYDTTYELHPYLTCIIGDNDIGKSVIATALKAVSYGDSSDSYIMHHENEAQVVLELNNNRQILWQRFRDTDQDNPQKVKFTLFKDDLMKPISEFNAHETPIFIQRELNISTIEDIDLHIGNQKQPVFLLSSDVKPQERAKILSLGKESLMIQKMMENLKTKTKQYKAVIKEGEDRFQFIEQMINVLSISNELVFNAEEVKSELFLLQKENEQIEELESMIHKVSLSKKAADLPKVDDYIIEFPQLYNISDLELIINDLEFNEKLSSIINIDYEFQIPELYNVDTLEEIINQLEFNEKIASISEIDISSPNVDLIDISELENCIHELEKLEKLQSINTVDILPIEFESINSLSIEYLEDMISKLEEHQEEIVDLENKQNNVKNWEIKINKEIEDFLENNHFCPTCSQKIDKTHILGEHHA